MHNTHYIIMNGEDKEDAIRNVESTLDEFGNENNWYNIEDAFDLLNPSEYDAKTINEHLKDLNAFTSKDRVEEIKKSIQLTQQKANDNPTERHYFWELSQLYHELYQLLGVGGEYTISSIVNGTSSDFNGFIYDEYGLTDLADFDRDDEDNTESLYFVIVDMHS